MEMLIDPWAGREVHVKGGQVHQKGPQSQKGPPGLRETKVCEPSPHALAPLSGKRHFSSVLGV